MPTPLLDNRQLGPDVARANLLTNGGFEIWQRGNGPFNTANAYLADRWQNYMPNGTTTNGKSTPGDLGVGSAASVQTTAPNTSIGNGVFQIVSGTDFPQLPGRTLSASVRVACSQPNSVRLGLDPTLAVSGPTVWSAFHSGGGGYETLRATITLASNATACTFWVAGVVAGSWLVDNAMLVVGSQPADYVPMHPADDLARCLRYYNKLGGYSSALAAFTVGDPGTSGSGYGAHFLFPTVMAVTPTLTKVGTWSVTFCAQPTPWAPNPQGFNLTAVPNAGSSYSIFSCTDATTYLTAEANP